MWNRVMALGYLGRDPELRTTNKGTPVCKFSIATSETYQGEKQTTWWSVVCWSKTAEIAAEYLHKGSLALVEGRCRERQWQNKDGETQRILELHADRVVLMPRGTGDASTQSQKEDEQDELPF